MMTIPEAIARSKSHTERVIINVADKSVAATLIEQAKAEALAEELEFNWTGENDGYDLWACEAGSEEMTWRIKLAIPLTTFA